MAAERGTMHCYDVKSDPMVASATWLGPLVYRDYDTLLSAAIAGELHPLLPTNVDASKVGCTGGSHGGLASFLYPVGSKAGKPFALSMPFEGTVRRATAHRQPLRGRV